MSTSRFLRLFWRAPRIRIVSCAASSFREGESAACPADRSFMEALLKAPASCGRQVLAGGGPLLASPPRFPGGNFFVPRPWCYTSTRPLYFSPFYPPPYDPTPPFLPPP